MLTDELLYIGKPLNLAKGTLVITESKKDSIYHMVWSLEGDEYATTLPCEHSCQSSCDDCGYIDLDAIRAGFRVYYDRKQGTVEIVTEKCNLKLYLQRSILQCPRKSSDRSQTDPMVAANVICFSKRPKNGIGEKMNGRLVITWQDNQYLGCYHLAYSRNGETWARYDVDVYNQRCAIRSILENRYYVSKSIIDDSICIHSGLGYVLTLPRLE
jgi:hypothetical protein